jgi:hypothetical protein
MARLFTNEGKSIGELAQVFFDEHNAKDAVVVAVYV